MRNKRFGIHHLVLLLALIILPVIMLYKIFNGYIPAQNLEDKQDKIELRFISSWGGIDTKAQLIQKLLEDFEKENPNVKIINESMSGSEFLFKLKTNFAQGNDPDVFGLWPGSDIKTLIRQGKVADISEVLEADKEWASNFGTDAWAYDELDGRIYGLPCEIIYEGLFINEDLFQKYHVKIPETYDDLLYAVKVFKENNIIPIAYNSTAEGTFLYQNIVMKLGGKEDTENPYKNGEVNQCYIDGMKYVKQLYELGAFPESAFIIDDRTRDNLFIEKKAAMIAQGSWFIGEGALNAEDKSVAIIPFPIFEKGKAYPTSIIYGLGNGNFHMSTAAWEDPVKRELCIKLLKCLTSVETAKLLSQGSGFISNIKIPDNELKPSRLLQEGKRFIAQSEELVGPTDSFLDRNLWEQVLVTRFPQVLEGKITPEEVFEEMEAKTLQK